MPLTSEQLELCPLCIYILIIVYTLRQENNLKYVLNGENQNMINDAIK